MTDITLNSITSGYNVNKINDNFDAIETVINEQVLHLAGGNNTLQQDLDMNGYALLNLESDPENPFSFAVQGDITNAIDAHVAEGDPHDQYAFGGDLTAHVDNVANPHSVTKSQVGLGNADNTSDADKPVSTAVQAALDLKATNPMTSVGDVIRGGASGAPTRVPIGTTGQVLKVIGGVPTWAEETAGGLSDAPINGNTYGRKDSAWVNLALSYQPVDPTLTSLAALGTGADKSVYFTGADVAAEYALTAYARTLLDDVNASAARTTLEVVKQTSTADATAGRLALVGAFGLGSVGESVSNANNIAVNGLYKIGGSDTGIPVGNLLGYALLHQGDAAFSNQIAFSYDNGKMYVRNIFNSVIGDWREVYTTSSPPPRLGVGQTWQSLTGSRAFGTTYTNSTGKPIMVAVSTNSSANTNSISATVAGVSIINDATSAGASGVASFVVPDGATYSVSSAKSLNLWAELR